jgi:EmrB/QacA subfamily drug resistance transporter
MSSSFTPAIGRTILLATILASSMAFIDSTALGVALPALQQDLNADAVQLLWVVNAYSLFLSALILVGSALGDRFGRNRIFGLGIIIFALASLACGLAPTIDLLIVARAVQGIGGAMMVPGSLAIVAANFPADQRGRAIGTWSMFSTLTTVLGPLLGGWLAGAGLWRAVFFINIPLAIIALAALMRVPESRDPDARRLDVPGAVLITLALAGISFGFIEAPELGLTSAQVLIALGLGLVSLIAFVIVEARVRHPLVPLSLFRSRTFSGVNLLTLLLYAALAIVFFFLPLNLITFQGYDPGIAGLVNLPFALMLVALARFAGAWLDRAGPRQPLIVGPALTGVGFLLLGLVGESGGSSAYFTTYFPGILLAGIGMGITVTPLSATVFSSAPGQMAGTASGVNNAVARTAGVLGTSIVGALAITLFATTLGTAVAASTGLSPQTAAYLTDNAALFTGLRPPAGLAQPEQAAAQGVITTSFLSVFQVVAIVSAALAWVSALMAGLLVEGRARPQPASPQQTPTPTAG